MDKLNSGELRALAQGPPSGQVPSQGSRRHPGLRVLPSPCCLLSVSNSWAFRPRPSASPLLCAPLCAHQPVCAAPTPLLLSGHLHHCSSLELLPQLSRHLSSGAR